MILLLTIRMISVLVEPQPSKLLIIADFSSFVPSFFVSRNLSISHFSLSHFGRILEIFISLRRSETCSYPGRERRGGPDDNTLINNLRILFISCVAGGEEIHRKWNDGMSANSREQLFTTRLECSVHNVEVSLDEPCIDSP